MNDFDKHYPVIEFIEYNVTTSLIDFFQKFFLDKQINNKKITIGMSYSDKNLVYKSPAIAIEIMYRKNRKIAFGDYYGEIYTEDKFIELKASLLEYRIQFNLYSNSGGENLKLSSLLDQALRYGDLTGGIPVNIYNDRGIITKPNVGFIGYDYSSDVKNNPMHPNIVTYDYYTIYEVKMNFIQKDAIEYNYMELGNIIGELKNKR